VVTSAKHRPALLLAALAAWIPATVAQEGSAGAVEGRYEWPARPPWAGEIFDLELVWTLDRETFRYLEGDLRWDVEPLAADPWRKPTLAQLEDPSGRPVSEITYPRRVMALAPGRIALPQATQSFAMQTGVFRTSEYERAIVESVAARSAPATLEVRPLPPPPAGFSGAVGSFSLQAVVEPLEAEVGQPVNWTLRLTGTGNWPALRGLPPRALDDAFEVAGDPELTETGESVFERELAETLVLVPRRAGRQTLRAAEMLVFDPAAGQYLRIRSQPVEIEVRPGAAQAAPPVEQPDYMRPAIEPRTRLLEGAGAARAPLPERAWRASLVLPPLVVLVTWLLLAWLRALRADPERLARRAHGRIARHLDAFAAAGGHEERRRCVRDWQRDVALRWKLAAAAPVPAAFGEESDWGRLWAEAEVFLYGRVAALPDDWLERARQRWRQLEAPPPFRPATVFRPANLNPLAWLLCVLLAGLPAIEAGAQAVVRSWQERVERDPLDWRARHNLAVALAEDSRPDEAAAQAALAWAQQPDSPDVRALWLDLRREAGFALSGAGGMPGVEGPWAALATRASPRTLQLLSSGAAMLAAAGALLVLLAGFGQLPRAWRRAGFALLAPALLGAFAATALLSYYGPLASRDAVLVWRPAPLRPVPVATLPEDEPVHLGGGSVGAARQEWLGWWRVDLGDGRQGWVRREDLLWVWQAGPPPAVETR
jgi:hypothetical protein